MTCYPVNHQPSGITGQLSGEHISKDGKPLVEVDAHIQIVGLESIITSLHIREHSGDFGQKDMMIGGKMFLDMQDNVRRTK